MIIFSANQPLTRQMHVRFAERPCNGLFRRRAWLIFYVSLRSTDESDAALVEDAAAEVREATQVQARMSACCSHRRRWNRCSLLTLWCCFVNCWSAQHVAASFRKYSTRSGARDLIEFSCVTAAESCATHLYAAAALRNCFVGQNFFKTQSEERIICRLLLLSVRLCYDGRGLHFSQSDLLVLIFYCVDHLLHWKLLHEPKLLSNLHEIPSCCSSCDPFHYVSSRMA